MWNADSAAVEQWLNENTFQCAIGRVSRAQCEANRKRQTWKEIAGGGFGANDNGHWRLMSQLARPKACEGCERTMDSEQWTVNSQYGPGERVEGKMEEITAKVCNACGQEKPLTEFHIAKMGKYGRRQKCKSCCADEYKSKNANTKSPAVGARSSERFLSSPDPYEGEMPSGAPARKRCKKCLLEKPLTEFNRDRISRDGHKNKCSDCTSEIQRKFREKRRAIKDVRAVVRQRLVEKKQDRVENWFSPAPESTGKERNRPAVGGAPTAGSSTDVVRRAAELIEEHWKYIEDLLRVHGVDNLELVGWHYKAAFLHGYKHGREDASDK
jgi:hypothetical protein